VQNNLAAPSSVRVCIHEANVEFTSALTLTLMLAVVQQRACALHWSRFPVSDFGIIFVLIGMLMRSTGIHA
jgi:hypothetical protein